MYRPASETGSKSKKKNKKTEPNRSKKGIECETRANKAEGSEQSRTNVLQVEYENIKISEYQNINENITELNVR